MENCLMFKNIVSEKIAEVYEKNLDNIEECAKVIVKSYEDGHKVYAIGSGHSHMMAEEVYARAGGTNVFTPILEPELMLHQNPFKSTYIEREVSSANIILDLYPMAKNDVLLIVSNSGINNLPIELALRAKKLGVFVISLSSLSLKDILISRHKCEKLLGEIADINLDNFGAYGDSVIELKKDVKIAPTSTIINSFIIQMLLIKICENLKSVEIFNSANTNVDAMDENKDVYNNH